MFRGRVAASLESKTPPTWRTLLAATTVPSADLSRRVALVTDELLGGPSREIAGLFADIDSPPPITRWDPPEATLGNDVLVFLLQLWHAGAAVGGLPRSRSIDPFELRPALGYVMLLEPIDGGADFRYRVYGSKIAEHSGIEMTGKRVWDIPSPLVAAYFLATYRAVYLKGRPMLARHTTHYDIQIAEWTRIILPFAGPDGAVDRLLVGNVPGVRTD